MMKTKTTFAALAAAALLGTSLIFADSGIAAADSPCPNAGECSRSVEPAAAPDEDFIKHMTWMREEERLARDVYRVLAEQHAEARQFERIAASEQRHFDAVGRVLTANEIDDPSAGLAPGKYAFDELQALHNRLVDQGSQSLEDAYAVGVEIEKADILDIQAAIDAIDDPSAQRVLKNLLAGSEKHLAAFERAAAGNDGSSPRVNARKRHGDRDATRQGEGRGDMKQAGKRQCAKGNGGQRGGRNA